MKRLFGFLLLPLISMVVSVVAIPILVATGGSEGWAAVAIGQGIGAIGSYVILFGWGVVGPHKVSVAPPDSHYLIYRVSVVMRITLGVGVLPLCVGMAWILAPNGFGMLSTLASLGFAMQGFAPGWFLIGQGRPLAIAVMDTVPRVAAQVFGAIFALCVGDLIAYAITLIAVETGIAIAALVFLGQPMRPASGLWSGVREAFREQWPLAASAVVGAGYTRAVVPLLAAVAYPVVAPFAALDRFQMLARGGLRPFVSFFQSWIPRPGRSIMGMSRPLVATLSVGFVAVAAGTVFAVMLPLIDDVLFLGEFEISPLAGIFLAVAIVAIGGSYGTGLFYLIPAGRLSAMSVSSIVGAVSALPLIFFLAPRAGVEGAMISIAIAEFLVLAWQILAIGGSFRRRGRRDDAS